METIDIQKLLSHYTAAILLAFDEEIAPLIEVHGEQGCKAVLSKTSAFRDLLKTVNPHDFPVILTVHNEMCQDSWRVASFYLVGAKDIPYIQRTIPGPIEVYDKKWVSALSGETQKLIIDKLVEIQSSGEVSAPAKKPTRARK